MKKFYLPQKINLNSKKITLSVLLLFFIFFKGFSHVPYGNVTIPTGSFIINMGVVPQTVANGLVPYGMIYDLLKNYKVPVDWVINTAEAKDGPDFTYNGVNYCGGTFIIEAKFITPTITARIVYWKGLCVQGDYNTSPVTVPSYLKFFNAPNWVLDLSNGGIAVTFFAYAQIPPSAYGGSSAYWLNPSQLTCCNDVFVLPHSNPTWTTRVYMHDFGVTCQSGLVNDLRLK